MIPPLRWRDASAADIPALQRFVCTEPAPRVPFKGLGRPPKPPRPWEMVAQGGVRNLAPPARDGQMMLLGEDDEGIAAAAWTMQVDGAHDVFVAVIAVALRLRHGSRYYGDDLLAEVQDRLVSDAIAAGKSELTISGKVDPKNRASKALLTRFHWETFDHAGRYERWLTYIPLAGAGE